MPSGVNILSKQNIGGVFMGKYKIGMGQYSNAIKIESFYEFFCSIPLDDLEDIRKMYMCYLSFANSYIYTIIEYEDKYNYKKENGWSDRFFLEKERKKRELMVRLTHDCYLAILLHKLDYDNYKNIIKGLYGYFEHSDAEINSPLLNYKTKEYILTKEQYIQKLIDSQDESTNVGDYLHTSSLGSIIEIEKEIIGPNEKIKCLRLDQQIPYGDLNIFK